MQKILIGFIALSQIFFVGCNSQKKNAPILEEEEMVELLVDIHMADAALNRGVSRGKINQSEVKKYYKDILEAHNISREQFDSVYNYYSKDFDNFEELYNEVILRLQKKKKNLELQKRSAKDSIE